ncbi:MAG: Rho GTPase-activating protein [Candidatus Berkiella sp.]
MLQTLDDDVVLKATSEVSLKKASKIAKFNSVLDQALLHIRESPTFLKEEGIIRISGSKTEIDSAFEKMLGKPTADLSGDPSQNPLSSLGDFTSNPHNVIGLLKKCLRDYPIHWSKEAQEEFEKFRQSNQSEKEEENKMSFEQLIDNLIARKLYDEAKVLHNILHLCYQASLQGEANKMPASNLFLALGPSIGQCFDLALDPSSVAFGLSKHPLSQHKGGQAQFLKAMKQENTYFSKPFFAARPDIANEMAKEYEDKKKYPPLVKPVVFLGIKLPTWMSRIIRAFKRNKPKEDQKERQAKEPSPSPQNVESPASVNDQKDNQQPLSPTIEAAMQAAKSVDHSQQEEKSQQNTKHKHHDHDKRRRKPITVRRSDVSQDPGLRKGLEQKPFKERKASVLERLEESDKRKPHKGKK